MNLLMAGVALMLAGAGGVLVGGILIRPEECDGYGGWFWLYVVNFAGVVVAALGYLFWRTHFDTEERP